MARNRKYKLIGRTSNFQNYNELDFSKNDYYRISKEVRLTIIKNKLNILPIDLNKVINNNKWKICSFNNAKNWLDNIDRDLTKGNLGFTLKIKRKYFIFYDNTISVFMQRFTIAHEIGHIVLNHFYGSNHVNDEKEANMFAARLLMPMCVLYECNVKSPLEIQRMCGVSMLAANYRFQRLKLVMSRNKFYTDRLESKVYELFKDYINSYNESSL